MALIGLVGWDIMLTLLHPTARGPVSYVSNRATWNVARAFSMRVLGGRGLNYAGPLAVVTNVLGWVLVLWVGYALVYLPFMDTFSYDPSTPFAGKGFLEALYLSGTCLTTVGFGDMAATSGVLRLVTVAEAASGFGVLSASIAYILSLYPLLTELRSTSLQLADSGALSPQGAAGVVAQVGTSELTAILRDLTDNHENMRRFPVLYYFETGNREESLSALLRGSTLLLVALRCNRGGEDSFGPIYAEAFEKSVGRLLDDLERDFVGGRRSGAGNPVPPDDTAERLRSVCRQLAEAGDGRSGPPDPGEEGIVDLVTRAEAVLAAIAHEHRHDDTPILSQ